MLYLLLVPNRATISSGNTTQLEIKRGADVHYVGNFFIFIEINMLSGKGLIRFYEIPFVVVIDRSQCN